MDRQDQNEHVGQMPLSKAEYVFQRLRQELRDGTIPPGAQIRQTEISARYGVSATPVREAMRLLEADGMIDYSPHRGATVTEMPKHDLHDLYLFRAEVEQLLVRLAVDRADDAAVAKLRSLHDEMVALVSADSPAAVLSRKNREFHLALMRAGSKYIADQAMRPLWEKAIPSSESLWDSPENVQRFLDAHEAILRALEARDRDEAGRLMAEHVHEALQERDVRNRGAQ